MSPDHLFTLRIPVYSNGGKPVITVHAFDANHTGPYGHSRIDVVVRFKGRDVFKRGDTYCGMPAGTCIDGDEAKEAVAHLVGIRPGDTDAEYFASYTKEQLAFVEQFADDISQYAERFRCRQCGAVRGRSKSPWEGKRCEGHGHVGDEG